MDDFSRIGTNSGHGHVWRRPDGVKSRCGGPGLCRDCAADYGLLNRSVQKGADTTAAHLIEAMKGQLLIVLVNRLGGEITLPVSEVDATDGFVLGMSVDQVAKTFTLTVGHKQ